MECTMIWSILAITAASAVWAFWWWYGKNDDYWKKRELPYDPRPNFFTAINTFFSRPMCEILIELQNKHGRIFGGFEFRTPNLSVSEPALLRDILVKDFHVFHYRRDVEMGDELFDKSVVALQGNDWKRVRTIITPAFTSRRMRQMTNVINECSETVLTTIGKASERGVPIDVKGVFGAFTMDVIASAAFATKIDAYNDPENIFIREVKRGFLQPTVMQLLAIMVLPTWFSRHLKLDAKSSMQFFKKVIIKVVNERRMTGKRHNDLLQLLMDAQEDAEKEELQSGTKNEPLEDETDRFGSVLSSELDPKAKHKKLSINELIAQCVLFFAVGYETTASALTFMAYELAVNPDCQEKLIQEIDETFEKQKIFDHDTVRDMKYLDCVVSETLRKYPALPRSERTASENYKLPNTDLIIEKGMVVGFNIYCMHHDPEFFPNPEKFQPERFFPENASHPQYAYLPFGAGPRNCLGMRFALLEMKLCICNILKRYRFKRADSTKVPPDFKKGFSLVSVDNLPLMVETRTE